MAASVACSTSSKGGMLPYSSFSSFSASLNWSAGPSPSTSTLLSTSHHPIGSSVSGTRIVAVISVFFEGLRVKFVTPVHQRIGRILLLHAIEPNIVLFPHRRLELSPVALCTLNDSGAQLLLFISSLPFAFFGEMLFEPLHYIAFFPLECFADIKRLPLLCLRVPAFNEVDP